MTKRNTDSDWAARAVRWWWKRLVLQLASEHERAAAELRKAIK